jgi:hypothetical protein
MIYAPRAIRHFSLANVEARAQRTARVMTRAAEPVRLHPEPAPPRGRVVIRLWLPTTALFLLLAPFALLLAPCLAFAPRRYRIRPLATVLGVGRVLLSLGGAVVHVDTPDALVSIRVF